MDQYGAVTDTMQGWRRGGNETMVVLVIFLIQHKHNDFFLSVAIINSNTMAMQQEVGFLT